MTTDTRHVFSVIVNNKPAVLARVAGLFARRGYNIESLSVGETESPATSRITLVVTGDEATLEQIQKQLDKLIDVLKIIDLTETKFVERELILIKVSISPENRSEVIQIAELFRARIVDVAERSLVLEATGDEGKLTAIVDMLKRFGVKEIVRTGKIALSRGMQASQNGKIS